MGAQHDSTDRRVPPPDPWTTLPSADLAELEAENRRLRAELANVREGFQEIADATVDATLPGVGNTGW